MMATKRRKTPWQAALGAAVLLATSGSPARAIEVQCGASGEGDAFGWAVATGGDYDGDSVADVAVGAPCAFVGSLDKAGRVRVYSGDTGAVIASLAGTTKLERYGAALDFVPDLNGDGKAELAIGAPAFDVPLEGGGTRAGAGRVEIRSAKPGNSIVWEVRGTNALANLGETVATLADLNGDGKREVAVGASEALVDAERRGIAYVFSGANGSLLGQDEGIFKNEHWASLVGAAGDVNGDGKQDWFASSNFASLPGPEVEGGVASTTTTSTTTSTTSTTTTTLIENAGRLSILSGVAPFEPLAELFGEDALERFGRAGAATTDGSGDGLSDLWIGIPGDRVSGANVAEAGAIELYTGTGAFVRRITEPSPQTLGGFGTAIVAPGSLDGGPGSDVVASAPTARVSGRAEAGRVHAFNQANGALLWTQDFTQEGGAVTGARLGWSLDSGIDFNGDGVQDILAGAPGATPNGRRGAGAAYLLSGANGGDVLATFPGRRGRETRIFAAGPGFDRRPVIRAYDPFGRRREAEIRPFRNQPIEKLSLALLDQSGRLAASKMLLAVGGGRNAGTNQVAVYRAVRRRLRVSLFTPAINTYAGPVNVAAGNFSAALGHTGDEIAVAPAGDVLGTKDMTGTVDIAATGNVAVYKRFSETPSGQIQQWDEVREFAAYRGDDKIDTLEVFPDKVIHGLNIVAGNLEGEGSNNAALDEIVAAPSAGLPVFRVFSSAGVKRAEFRAYPSTVETPNSGVSLAIASLRGGSGRQILTAPASGELWVRAWSYDEDLDIIQPFRMTLDSEPVSFFVPSSAFGPTFQGGLTIAAADVDFDGADEILVAPGAGVAAKILAFEADGTQVAGWTSFQPYGPLAVNGLSILGTNDYWRP